MIHTAYDVMKEFLITDSVPVGRYGMPKIPRTYITPGTDTVDFAESFSKKIKNHRELDVNFYIDDVQFQRVWNYPGELLPLIEVGASKGQKPLFKKFDI